MVEESKDLINKWIMTDSKELCKVVYLKGQLFVVGVDSESAITYRMLKSLLLKKVRKVNM
jgi:hypothetical protein